MFGRLRWGTVMSHTKQSFFTHTNRSGTHTHTHTHIQNTYVVGILKTAFIPEKWFTLRLLKMLQVALPLIFLPLFCHHPFISVNFLFFGSVKPLQLPLFSLFLSTLFWLPLALFTQFAFTPPWWNQTHPSLVFFLSRSRSPSLFLHPL